MLGLRGVFFFFLSGRFMCVLALLPVLYSGMELILISSVLLLLFACSMRRGQEETSTSHAWHGRGPDRDTPSASNIISSLFVEELRSYCQIPDNIDIELPNGPAKSTIGEGEGAVYFTREQLAAGLRFPFSSLIKQFLHFSGASPAFIHPNVIRILVGCSVLNLSYQLDISLVDVYFIYTLKLAHGGQLSLSAQSPRLQFVTGLPDSPKTEAKGMILLRGSWYETLGSPDLPFTLNQLMGFPGVFKFMGFVCCFYILLYVHPAYFLNKYFFVQRKAREVDW